MMGAWLLAIWVCVQGAFAQFPLDPQPDCGPSSPESCPSDFLDWSNLSWIPSSSLETVREEEVALGAGVSLDRALVHTGGRWDVPVAVLDSGILWHRERLLKKLLINDGELPLPMLADGTVAEDWDVDGNGVFNVEDYAQDPRVSKEAGDPDGAKWLDPSDLIAVFSDGVDDDGNGYVDDICGWDFFSGDNNPFAQLQTGFANHGSGVADEAAGAAGDGGSLGMCPNCAILPIRLGDAFITDGRRIALSIHFAVDSGARALAMATGGLSHNDSVREAVDYAEKHGVVIVGAAGDENSYHRNFPAVENKVLFVHSIRGNNQNEHGGSVESFMNFLHCNNYGPRMDLVAPSTACATGATAKIAGAAGMLISAGLDYGVDLSAAQVRNILRSTVDDVALNEEDRAAVNTLPSMPGWDAFYGYGRLNLGAAVERVVDGELGPELVLTGPEWFSWQEETVALTGLVNADTWTVSMGQGMEPQVWETVYSGEGDAEGHLATLDLTGLGFWHFDSLHWETVLERVDRAHEPLVTVRVEAVADGLVTEERLGFWVHQDGTLSGGLPWNMGASIESSAQLVDMDSDGIFEIVVATSDGRIHVRTGRGEALDGFPVRTEPDEMFLEGAYDAAGYKTGELQAVHESLLSAPAIGDVDGDGQPDVVVVGLGGRLYAWNAKGELLDGFPVRMTFRAPEEMEPGRAWDNGFYGNPALGDVDGDGDLEIVAGAGDQRLYVWDGDGSLLDGYPMELCGPDLCGETGARIVASAALGDIDGDGDLDAALGTNESPKGAAGLLYLVDLAAAEVWDGYPLGRSGLINQSILPVLGEGHVSSPALADMDGDGDLELASAPMLGTSSPIHHDGSDVVTLDTNQDRYGESALFTDGALVQMINNPSFGDLNGDGVKDLLGGGASPLYLISLPLSTMLEFQHGMGAWDGTTGQYLDGFPQQNDDVAFLTAPAVADVSGDGLPEALYSGGGHFLYAADATGAQAPGFPKFTGGWAIGSPAIGDVDGDGLVEVVLGTREGWLFVWDTQGSAATPVQWSGTRHDPANTGNAENALVVQAGPPEEGCCSNGAEGSRAMFLLAVPLLVGMQRRRRASLSG
jgi:hypothetical protein